jgi:D-inositol-3-phosphate glycosyltransferase
MRAVLICGVPVAPEPDDTVRPASGTKILRDQVTGALLRHGAFDDYFVLSSSVRRHERQPPRPATVRRTTVLSACDLSLLDTYDDVVLFAPSSMSSMLGAVALRQARGATRWLVSSVTQSLDGPGMPLVCLALAHADVDMADSLISMSSAAKVVVERLFLVAARTKPTLALPVIPSGVDCDAFEASGRESGRRELGAGDETVVILYLGRLSPVSKCDLSPLLLVFSRLVTGHPDTLLVLAGDDTEHGLADLLTVYAEDLGCGNRVRVVPDVTEKEKRALLAAADIFVAPNDHVQESFGVSIVEAMASGLPVVASDWSGHKELVVHGETGFRVPTYWLPSNDQIDDLAFASLRLRNSAVAAATIVDVDALEQSLGILTARPELRRAMGTQGQRRARERYDWSRVIRAYETTWAEGLSLSRELRPSTRRSGYPSSHYGYSAIFDHYPSQVLDDHCCVRLTTAAEPFLEGGESLLPLSPNGILDEETVTGVLQIVSQIGPSGFATVVDTVVRQMQLPGAVAWTSVASALKYGLLTFDRLDGVAPNAALTSRGERP